MLSRLVLVSLILTHHGISVMRVSIRWKREELFILPNAGLKELKIEIDKYLKRRFGVSYDYNNEIMVTVGAVRQLILRCVPCLIREMRF